MVLTATVPEETAMDLLTLVGSGMTTVLGWINTVVTAMVTTDGDLNALAPLFAIGIAISGILLGVKLIKSLVWGA